MSIAFSKPGLLTTLVAGERNGYRNIGVGPGGAMDQFAMKVSNYLVGNQEDHAVIEFNFPAPEIQFKQSLLIGVTGKNFEVLVNDVIVPLWRPVGVEKNSVVKFKNKSSGGRGYLSVQSGWKAQEWLGSTTTHLEVEAGGHRGRALQKTDVIETNENGLGVLNEKGFPWSVSKNELNKIYSPASEIRCVPNAETDLLAPEFKKRFTTQALAVTPQSNRMGYRLEGETLHLGQPIELVSSPVDFGTIQLLPNGNLIVLMADHQTTGGYPRIGSVIKSDLPKLSQLGSSDSLNFKMISLAEAEDLLLSMEGLINQIKHSCFHQLSKYIAR